MGIYYQPPPPFMGGGQPHAPARLPAAVLAFVPSGLPFTYGGPIAIKAAIVAIAQPNPWTYIFLGGSQPYARPPLPPAITAVRVDNPPFCDGGPVPLPASIVAMAQPNPWTWSFMGRQQPFGARQLSPAIPGQSADPPPVSHPGRSALAAQIVTTWQPNPWTWSFMGRRQPFERAELSPGLPGLSTDAPPFTFGGPYVLKAEIVAIAQPEPWSYTAWPYRFMGNRQPYMARTLPAALIGVAVSPFPFSHGARSATNNAIRAAWNPPPPDFQMQLYATRFRPQRIAPRARGYIIL